jgi:hypothetical protein
MIDDVLACFLESNFHFEKVRGQPLIKLLNLNAQRRMLSLYLITRLIYHSLLSYSPTSTATPSTASTV